MDCDASRRPCRTRRVPKVCAYIAGRASNGLKLGVIIRAGNRTLENKLDESIRHMLMVTAVLQCASETLHSGGNASEAAARCIEMFGRLFPDATRDELRSAVLDAERRKSEMNTIPRVDVSLNRRAKPRTSVSLAMYNPPQSSSHSISTVVGRRGKVSLATRFVRRLSQFCRGLRPSLTRPVLVRAGTVRRGFLLPPNQQRPYSPEKLASQ